MTHGLHSWPTPLQALALVMSLSLLKQTSGIDFCGVKRNTQMRSSNLVIMFCGFLKEKKCSRVNSRKDGLVHSRYTIVFLVYVNNFEPNPILVNVNKLKPYKYVDQTLKGIQILEN